MSNSEKLFSISKERSQELLDVGAQMRSISEQFNTNIRDASEQLRKAFDGVLEIQFGKQLQDIFKQGEATLREMEPDAYSLGLRGWTLPMWAPLGLAAAIVRDVPITQTDAFFLDTYCDNQSAYEKEMLEELPSHASLRHWAPLLEQSIEAYRGGKYLIAVPALLAMFEGALATAGHTFTTWPEPLRTATRQRQNTDSAWLKVCWASLAGFVSLAFGHHSFAGCPPTALNRHWVLHGRDVPNWNRVDCLRLFQALETVAVIRTPPLRSTEPV
jgi:hypothetical protein